jgi:HEAT repeat protein
MIWLAKQQLKSKSSKTRLQAVSRLRKGSADSVVSVLVNVLRTDEEAVVRAEAARALGEHPGQESLAALGVALMDHAPEVRYASVEALRALGDSGAVSMLEPVLRTPDPELRARVAQTLYQLGWQAPDQQTEAVYLVARGELDRAAILGKAAVVPLSEMLKNAAYQHRVVAVNRLAEIGDESVVKPLLSVLNDREAIVRTAVAGALGQMRVKEAVRHVLGLLRDREANVRVAAAGALGLIEDPQAVDNLVIALNDKHWEVRAAAVEALGRLRDARSIPAMCEALRDKDREVREQACEALGVMGRSEAAPALVLAMLDSQRVVRYAAARSLQRVDPYWERLARVQAVLEEVRQHEEDPDYGVRQAAQDILRRCSGARGESHTTVTTARRKRSTANEILTGLLADKDAAVRQAALECLADHPERPKGAWWAPLVEDADESVRSSANRVASGMKPAEGAM